MILTIKVKGMLHYLIKSIYECIFTGAAGVNRNELRTYKCSVRTKRPRGSDFKIFIMLKLPLRKKLPQVREQMFHISFYKARGEHEIINDLSLKYFNFRSTLSVGFWLQSGFCSASGLS